MSKHTSCPCNIESDDIAMTTICMRCGQSTTYINLNLMNLRAHRTLFEFNLFFSLTFEKKTIGISTSLRSIPGRVPFLKWTCKNFVFLSNKFSLRKFIHYPFFVFDVIIALRDQETVDITKSRQDTETHYLMACFCLHLSINAVDLDVDRDVAEQGINTFLHRKCVNRFH